jgi:hypothetical protein
MRYDVGSGRFLLCAGLGCTSVVLACFLGLPVCLRLVVVSGLAVVALIPTYIYLYPYTYTCIHPLAGFYFS